MSTAYDFVLFCFSCFAHVAAL